MPFNADDRDRLSPADALGLLREGNERFCADALLPRAYDHEIAATAAAQYPFAAVLTCIDSRIPVEIIFDQSIGDLFVGRVAGNYVDEGMLGGLEFTTAVAGAKLLVVMGHRSCGAVSAACDGVAMGHLTHTLRYLAPALERVETDGERSSANPDFVQAVAEMNVHHNVEKVLARSETIRALVDAGEVLVLGAMYDLTSGRVTFYDPPGIGP